MGKPIIKGWRTPFEIPQPTSIIMGRNLRKPEPVRAAVFAWLAVAIASGGIRFAFAMYQRHW